MTRSFSSTKLCESFNALVGLSTGASAHVTCQHRGRLCSLRRSRYVDECYSETNCASFSLAVIAFYEYIITFDQELNLVWRRKWTISTILFVIMRYLMLFIALWQGTPPTNGVRLDDPRAIVDTLTPLQR